jgi:hypothetical protein
MLELLILGKLASIREEIKPVESPTDFDGVLVVAQIVLWPLLLLGSLWKLVGLKFGIALGIVVNVVYFSVVLGWFWAIGIFIGIPVAAVLSFYLDND